MNDYRMRNIWLLYGLRSSPYFVNPLDSVENSLFPVSLFVGRQEETQLVLDRIASTDNSRIVIEGVAGVGKTTFIHHLKHLASENNPYLAFYDHIRLTEEYTSTQFAIDVIHNTLLGLYRCHPDRVKEFEKDETLQNAKRFIMEIVEDQWGVGATLFGVGGSLARSKSRVSPLFQPQQFYSFLEEIAISVKSHGFGGVVIHINNIENLCLESPEVARRFFNDIRDFLMLPGFHFIFGARLGFTDEILGKDERVRSIFAVPTILQPLEISQTHDLLDKRYAFLRDEGCIFVKPVENDVIENYHEMFRGDLRSMFSTISDAIELRGHQLEPNPLPYRAINPILREKYETYLRSKFSASAWKLLEMLKDEEEMFRQSDIPRKKTGLSQGRISQIFTELELGGGINCIETKGRSKYYDLSGISKIVFGKEDVVQNH